MKFLKTCVTECRYASAIMLIVIILGLSGVLGGMLIGSRLGIIIPNFVKCHYTQCRYPLRKHLESGALRP